MLYNYGLVTTRRRGHMELNINYRDQIRFSVLSFLPYRVKPVYTPTSIKQLPVYLKVLT